MNGTFRLVLFYAVFFVQVGVYLPYWPIWLASRGLSPEAIGVLLATSFWARLFVAPYVGTLADRTRNLPKLLAWFAVLACAGFALFGAVQGFPAFFCAMLLVGAGNAPLMPLVDALVLKRMREGALDYGRVRLWGSVSFIVATLVAGAVLERASPVWIYRLVLAAGVLLVLASWALPSAPGGEPVSGSSVSVFKVLALPRFPYFLGAAVCLHTSHAVLTGFASLHWGEHGGIDARVIGALWAEGVVSEIVVFALGARLLGRLGLGRVFLLASIAGLVRWPLMAASLSLPTLVFAQALHGLSFGAAHLACMEFIRKQVPSALTHTASSLYTAVVLGLGLGLAMPASGVLYASFAGGAFWFMLAPSALGGLFAHKLRDFQAAERTSTVL